jgi:DNA-binding GntR family transcriptional regulator
VQADAAYERLRGAIVEGRYAAGSRLTEVELADSLGMSRTPVREALRRLAGDGLVRASDRGVIVDLMDAEEAHHARTVRAALDVLTAELAARRQRDGEISPAALRAAEDAAAEAEKSIANGADVAAYEADQRLHRQIAEMAGNPVALEMLDRLTDRLAVAKLAREARALLHLSPDETAGEAAGEMDAVRRFAIPTLNADLGEEHRRLLAAITAGQPAAAWLAAREHAHG